MDYFEVKEMLKTHPKRWLVTGCAGFIGSNLIENLLLLNQKVVGLDNFSTGFQHNLDQVRKLVSEEQWSNFSFIEGDVTNFETCIAATKNLDIVLHQAALGSVPRSIENPINSNASNVTGFLNMMTASKENSVKRFVYASSSSVYGDSQELPKVEEQTGNLLSPYAVTKYVNELYMGVFFKCYGFESIGLRYFNVFGKRQDPNGSYAAVMPKWISAMLKDEDVFINGDGETSRDFTYIDNVIQANILSGVTNNPKSLAQSYNIAAGGRETLNNLFYLLRDGIKRKIPNIDIKDPIYRGFRAGDIRHSNANINKAKEFLQYVPSHSLEQGLSESIDWYIQDVKR